MKNYDTIVFDLDGTLIDTLEDLKDSVNYAMNVYGFPERSLEEIRTFVGNGVGKLIERAIPDGIENPLYKECLKVFQDHYSKNMQNKTAPYNGIKELLAELKDRGFKMAVVSNKFDSAVKELVKEFFGDYIKVAIGESENVSRKPAPDTVIKALAELGSAPDKAVYVGDSEVDVMTAKNSKLTCIGVTWGFRTREVLEKEGAQYIIDEPHQLLSILD
ncbi:MAG TPA: HAD-IA family hydrolase [Clostridiaceae bacterium]|nr:HAD-IA family hydrolase [Clostridiaceae bacterium]